MIVSAEKYCTLPKKKNTTVPDVMDFVPSDKVPPAEQVVFPQSLQYL